MRRPEGFDRRPEPEPEPDRPARRLPRFARKQLEERAEQKAPTQRHTEPSRGSGPTAQNLPTQNRTEPSHGSGPTAQNAETAPIEIPRASRGPRLRMPRSAPRPKREPDPRVAAARERRHAARDRRRYERAEVRRFTRHRRARRITLAVVAGVVAVLTTLVLVAIYSPLLALRTIVIEGTGRIDAGQVQEALSTQLETPLALLDYDGVTEDLSRFPLIRSYTTRTVPPDTLVVSIVERQPVATVQRGDGFELVDPAGVTIERAAERVGGVPLMEFPDGDDGGRAFDAAVSVLLALPADLLPQVDVVSARTADDVTLRLTGVGQSVVWGSSEDSERKARLLAALRANTDPELPGEFDVSAPGNGIFRQG